MAEITLSSNQNNFMKLIATKLNSNGIARIDRHENPLEPTVKAVNSKGLIIRYNYSNVGGWYEYQLTDAGREYATAHGWLSAPAHTERSEQPAAPASAEAFGYGDIVATDDEQDAKVWASNRATTNIEYSDGTMDEKPTASLTLVQSGIVIAHENVAPASAEASAPTFATSGASANEYMMLGFIGQRVLSFEEIHEGLKSRLSREVSEETLGDLFEHDYLMTPRPYFCRVTVKGRAAQAATAPQPERAVTEGGGSETFREKLAREYNELNGNSLAQAMNTEAAKLADELNAKETALADARAEIVRLRGGLEAIATPQNSINRLTGKPSGFPATANELSEIARKALSTK